MIGQIIGHYRVLEQIGAGGMGVVYRAKDERLDRDVALKVLPPGKLTDDTPRKRFRNEALALAKLNHPNIGTVFDFDSQDDVDFLVMEYIPGETLHHRLGRGPLTDKELIPLALQITAALEEAHEHGIVHQDLKPGNIMVTPKGQAKVLDFGLSRLLEDGHGDRGATLSEAATASGAGTLPYMSPEQILGDTVDARSDIYSAGVVFYEMSAGQRPFQHELSQRLVQQILTEQPRPLHDWNRRVSPQLEGIISKALDKQPGLRYQTARELRVDLERVVAHSSSSAVPIPPISATARWKLAVQRHSRAVYSSALLVAIAAVAMWWFASARPVLSFAPRDWLLITDFDNQTKDPLFDSALATALTVSLEQSPHANVVPRARITDALQRMGKPRDEKITQDLAREISVREGFRAVLSCSIARVGQQYALTAQLIDPQTGTVVRPYYEQAKDQDHILDALGSVATRVRRDLGESLLATRKSDRPLPQVTTPSLAALKMYADANALWRAGHYDQAEHLYLSAVQLDPAFAMAHSALGSVYYSHLFNNPTAGKEHFLKALALSERTTDRERLYIQTRFAQDQGHLKDAFALFDVYLKTYPDDWGMRENYAALLRHAGQCKEAIEQYNEVIRISPKYVSPYIDIATCQTMLGNPVEALHYYELAFQLDPSEKVNSNINNEYGMTLFRSGDEAKARETFQLAFEQPELKPRGLRSLAWLDLYHGKYAMAKSRLAEALISDKVYKWSLSILREHNILAIVADGQGDSTSRMRELDDAIQYLAGSGIQVRPGLWLGLQYARAGNTAKAADILERVRPQADLQNVQDASDLQTLEGEVEFAKGNRDHAIELFLSADRILRNPITLQSLARAYDLAGSTDQAATWYETALAGDPVGYEAQQDWLTGRYHLARIYFAKGDAAKASAQLDPLLEAWKEADPGLPLLRDARLLHEQISSKH